MMLLIIDNYDSFTYNLYQYFLGLGTEVQVIRNDAIDIAGIEALKPSYLVISPGPGSPSDSGISLSAIKYFAGKLPILGVCLGHQAIAQAFGGEIIKAKQVMHGKNSSIYHLNKTLFQHLNQPLIVTRYHSLIVNKESLPDCFEVTAWTETNEGEVDEIMAISHKTLPIESVQFHPESIMTEQGSRLLSNFIQRYQSIEF